MSSLDNERHGTIFHGRALDPVEREDGSFFNGYFTLVLRKLQVHLNLINSIIERILTCNIATYDLVNSLILIISFDLDLILIFQRNCNEKSDEGT